MDSWYKNGLKFECQGSGKCCTSHGEYGYVYLTNKDIKKASQFLNLTVKKFINEYCELDHDSESYFLNQGSDKDCLFLQNKKCSIYTARPMQCKTWPFWSETMNAKTWKKEVANFCPGINKGRLYSAQEIDNIVNEQLLSEI